MTGCLSLPARLFDGRSLEERRVRLELGEVTARIVFAEHYVEVPVAKLRVSPPSGCAPRFVTLPDGGELLCDEHPALQRLPTASRTEGPVTWLERRLWVAVVAVVAMVAGISAFYFFGLPRLADTMAQRLSPEHERALGEQALRLLDSKLVEKTNLDAETVAQVQSGFARLVRELPHGEPVRLEFIDMGALANAFALPGRVVVITDAMVMRCSVDESIVILAHELGHVTHRHALRHMAQELGVTALGTAMTADASSTVLSATTVPILFAKARYSRNFEEEADATGFELARRAGFSPALFASCLERLRQGAGGDDAGYLSSHPPDRDRIARARDAAAGFGSARPAVGSVPH